MLKYRSNLAATLLLIVAVVLLAAPSVNAQKGDKGSGIRPLLNKAAQNQPNKVEGEVLVVFKAEAVDAASREVTASSLAAQIGGTVKQHVNSDGSDFYVFAVTAGQEEASAAQLRQDGRVESSDPNYVRYLYGLNLQAEGKTESGEAPNRIPNDPYYAQYQWDMTKIGMPRAWDVRTDSPVRVAIIDTGIDLGHPEFAGRIAGGVDLSGEGSTGGNDTQGHGTHVAGTVGAAGNNGVGVTGMNWNVQLLAVKVFAGETTADSIVIAGVNWARTSGANVMNMSLGGSDYSTTFQNAVNAANSAGILVVAAAGNEAEEGNPVSYPCAYNYVICVGATGNTDNWAYYSNYNGYVDISAPGGDARNGTDPDDRWIASTYFRAGSGYPTNGYNLLIGTSMASPHVAGMLALLKGRFPGRSNDWYINRMNVTAVDLGTPGRDVKFGVGRINVGCAVEMAFSDVNCSYWAYTSIQFLAGRGISSGDANGNFNPEAYTRRDEFAKFIVLAASWPLVNPPTPSFSDVPPSNPLYRYIETAKSHGVINGNNGRFNPSGQIRRDEMAKIVVLAKGYTLLNPGTPSFADVPTSNIFYRYIETAKANGVVSGSGGAYNPSNSSTRAQMAKVLDNAY